MGILNSSLTRVAPIFDCLFQRDPTGMSWVLPLLSSGSHANGKLEGLSGQLIKDHELWWGKRERRLLPPKSLLSWLPEHLSAPSSEKLWGSPATREKREKLVKKDPWTIAEARERLKGPYRKAWYTLEGISQPDVFLETEHFIVVIEGKRTERKATTTTTWMPGRSQMLRHMDAAWEIRGGKRVFGLMIVEGDGPAPQHPSKHWLAESSEVIKPATLEASLPHRGAVERKKIADGYLGITTWQKVCSQLRLDWPPC